jgi:hypothetical protein
MVQSGGMHALEARCDSLIDNIDRNHSKISSAELRAKRAQSPDHIQLYEGQLLCLT